MCVWGGGGGGGLRGVWGADLARRQRGIDTLGGVVNGDWGVGWTGGRLS